MRKILITIVAMLLSVLFVLGSVVVINAESTKAAIPDDAIVTYGALKEYLEQFKQEILQSIQPDQGGTQSGQYSEISVKQGSFIYIHENTELIYRGGGAAVITPTDTAGWGIKDMSMGTELFSGAPLEYGHIYYSDSANGKKAILITGATAYFTVKGDYEIA